MLELIDSSPLQVLGGALVLLLALRHATRTEEWRVVFVIAWLITVVATIPAALKAPAGDVGLLAWSPWTGVLLVAAAVGVMVAVFYGILRPRTLDRSLDRLALATLFALAISLLLSPLRPDRSGAYYVVGWFGVFSAFLLLLVALAILLRDPRKPKRWRRIFGVAWLASVLGTMPAALVPPYWAGRGLVPYEPWTGVLLVSVAVGFMTIVLYAILRPGSFSRSWGRLVFAILFTLAMTFLFSPRQLHMSGSFYAVGWFSVFSTCLLLLVSLALVGGSIKRRWRSRQVWLSR